jgi:hypothetical protein
MTPTLTSRSANSRQPLTPTERIQRRKLIFQDTLALVSLLAISICIAVLTYFFFHSFREHRSVLEKRWYARGELALAERNPQYAVEAFRSALSLSTANPTYELALAEALAAANRNYEAYAYFSSLHDARPGDGFLNLQLARLEVKRNDPAQAIDYYRAALSGLWYGQGAAQRFQIRLELAKYLTSLGKNIDAQGDLLTAEGNSLDHPAELFEVATLLQQTGDPSDAWTAYRRVENHAGASPSEVLKSLHGEAQVAMAMGQYKRAALALDRYNTRARQHAAASTAEERHAAERQLGQLQRMLQLIPFYALPPKQHAERVLLGTSIAHKRYASCAAQLAPENISGDDAAALDALGTQWTQIGATKSGQLAGNAPLEQRLVALTNQTEMLTARLCGALAGDDALLLQLAQNPDKTE